MNSFAVGYRHSIRLDEDGVGYIWGNSSDGQLGLGDTQDRNIPTVIPSPNDYKWISFVCGSSHSFGMTENREVFGWGNNYFGQLTIISENEGTNVYKPRLLKCP